jgi:hypothetical protein
LMYSLYWGREEEGMGLAWVGRSHRGEVDYGSSGSVLDSTKIGWGGSG